MVNCAFLRKVFIHTKVILCPSLPSQGTGLLLSPDVLLAAIGGEDHFGNLGDLLDQPLDWLSVRAAIIRDHQGRDC